MMEKNREAGDHKLAPARRVSGGVRAHRRDAHALPDGARRTICLSTEKRSGKRGVYPVTLYGPEA